MSQDPNGEDRVHGQYPLSIATSMAVEGLMGVHPDLPPPKTPPYLNHKVLYVNVRTLFRNLHAAIEKESRTLLRSEDFAEAVATEMQVLTQIIQSQTNGIMRVQYYLNTYKTLHSAYPNARYKETLTENQKLYEGLELMVMKRIANDPNIAEGMIQHGDMAIDMEATKALVITHLPIDLLHAKGYTELCLLESHTGVIKDRYMWYTKLNGGRTLSNIPFDRMTIQFFGDTGSIFKPFPTKFRTTLTDIAAKYSWSPRTTKDRIMVSLEAAREPVLMQEINKLYSAI